jgi:hypothetical protein
MASLAVAFIVISTLADKGVGPPKIAIGVVAGFHEGEWMLVANQGMRLPVAFRKKTAYDGDPADIKTGSRVMVWYRGVGERRPVADKVRIIN